jgi:Uncharacterized conserved protein (DUF2304).
MGSISLLRIVYLISGLGFSGIVVYLLAKKKLNERNTILWLTGALGILIIAAFPSLLNWTARKLGVDYPPALLFLFSALILLLIVLYQSIQISVLNSKLTQLVQYIALQSMVEAEKEVAVDRERDGQ